VSFVFVGYSDAIETASRGLSGGVCAGEIDGLSYAVSVVCSVTPRVDEMSLGFECPLSMTPTACGFVV
jgi:hypothetical protein